VSPAAGASDPNWPVPMISYSVAGL